MDAKQVLAKLHQDNKDVVGSIVVCTHNIGSQRWAGMIVGAVSRDGNTINVKVLKSAPAFPSYTVGRICPMSLSYFNAMGGNEQKVGRNSTATTRQDIYTSAELFDAIDMSGWVEPKAK